MGGALILALLGMGVAASAMMYSTTDDDTADDNDTVIDDTEDQMVLQLNALDTITASDAGEVFAAQDPRGPDGKISVVEGFDADQDIVAFDLDALTQRCLQDPDGPPFSADATLGYEMRFEEAPDENGTRVTLALFDDADPEGAVAHFDVLLRGAPDITGDNISVVVGTDQLSQAVGGERAEIATGSDGGDTIALSAEPQITQSGNGNDMIVGQTDQSLILTGSGDDTVDVTGQNLHIYGGSGADNLSLTSAPGSDAAEEGEVFGGDGDDTISIGLGVDGHGGLGTDTLTLNISEPPLTGQPLFLWNQPVEDARFSGHSVIRLEDDADTVRINIAPEVGGHLHQVNITQESFGTSSQEVYIRAYTLIVWTPDSITDISREVSGSASTFNGTLAQDSSLGEDAYEQAANDVMAPRVVLTIENGMSYSGDFDDVTGETTDGYNSIFDADLVMNREVTSIHRTEIY